MTTTTPRRIYVACLASYNAGILHGRWIDANQDVEDMQHEVKTMLLSAPACGEEWAIQDYDGFPPGTVGEYTDFHEVVALADFLDEHGDLGEAVLENFLGNLGDAREAIEYHYAGEWSDLATFVEDLFEESATVVPVQLSNYIDWAAMGRDMELGGDIWTVEGRCGSVHVFWSH